MAIDIIARALAENSNGESTPTPIPIEKMSVDISDIMTSIFSQLQDLPFNYSSKYVLDLSLSDFSINDKILNLESQIAQNGADNAYLYGKLGITNFFSNCYIIENVAHYIISFSEPVPASFSGINEDFFSTTNIYFHFQINENKFQDIFEFKTSIGPVDNIILYDVGTNINFSLLEEGVFNSPGFGNVILNDVDIDTILNSFTGTKHQFFVIGNFATGKIICKKNGDFPFIRVGFCNENSDDWLCYEDIAPFSPNSKIFEGDFTICKGTYEIPINTEEQMNFSIQALFKDFEVDKIKVENEQELPLIANEKKKITFNFPENIVPFYYDFENNSEWFCNYLSSEDQPVIPVYININYLSDTNVVELTYYSTQNITIPQDSLLQCFQN